MIAVRTRLVRKQIPPALNSGRNHASDVAGRIHPISPASKIHAAAARIDSPR